MQLSATKIEVTAMSRSSKCGWLGSSVMGPPTILFSLAVLAEIVFWAGGIESQMSEVWLVLVAVPLLLHFAAPTAKPSPPKKIVEDEVDDSTGKLKNDHNKKTSSSRKSIPGGKNGGKPAPREFGPLDAERAAFKVELEKCVQAGDSQNAGAIFQKLIDNGAANAVCFNMMINLCAKQKQTKDAQMWMRKMLDSDVKPDAASFNSTIDACARAGDTSKAEFWLQKMTEAEVLPNTITCNTLINACAKFGDVERAERWMKKFIEQGVVLDVISYSAMINACTKRGDVAGAENWLAMMNQNGVDGNVVTYSTLISAYARVGNKTGAERFGSHAWSWDSPRQHLLQCCDRHMRQGSRCRWS